VLELQLPKCVLRAALLSPKLRRISPMALETHALLLAQPP